MVTPDLSCVYWHDPRQPKCSQTPQPSSSATKKIIGTMSTMVSGDIKIIISAPNHLFAPLTPASPRYVSIGRSHQFTLDGSITSQCCDDFRKYYRHDGHFSQFKYWHSLRQEEEAKNIWRCCKKHLFAASPPPPPSPSPLQQPPTTAFTSNNLHT